jgi:hypothetical protein
VIGAGGEREALRRLEAPQAGRGADAVPAAPDCRLPFALFAIRYSLFAQRYPRPLHPSYTRPIFLPRYGVATNDRRRKTAGRGDGRIPLGRGGSNGPGPGMCLTVRKARRPGRRGVSYYLPEAPWRPGPVPPVQG